MPTISFKFRSRTQSQILDLDNCPNVSAGGIKGRDARELIATVVGTPVEEIEIYFGVERIHEEEMIPFYSCVDVERLAAVKRPSGGRGGGAAGKVEGGIVISATGTAYRVGRGGTLINANAGAGRFQQNAPVVSSGGADGGEGKPSDDAEAAMLRGLQHRMADGVESVAVETRRGGGRGRGGGAGGADPAGGGNFGPPPAGYVCHNCGSKGHFIEDCPNPRTQRGAKMIAPPTGIAESMLVECSADDPARCVTRDGRFVKRIVATDLFVEVAAAGGNTNDEEALAKLGEGDAVADVLRQAGVTSPTPDASSPDAAAPASLEEANLLCYQCKKLLNKAVQLPCPCAVRFCSAGDCIDKYMETKDEEAVCPKCDELFGLDELDEIPLVREQVENVRQLLKKRPRE